MMKRLPLIGFLFLALLAAPAMADSWIPPEVRSYSSANGAWKLTVYPRALRSRLAYFKDAAADKPNAGGVPGDSQRSAMGHMERLQSGRWQSVWKRPLANDVAPVDVVVSNDGLVATFDNWHSMGWGDDAVVIYSTNGDQVTKFGLSSFLPKYYFDALPRSVSSIHWRNEPHIDENRRQLVIPVVVPTEEDQVGRTENRQYVDIRFDLSDGTRASLDDEAWADANASAKAADTRRRQLLDEARTRFTSPLAAPLGGDVSDWHAYLIDAFFRVDPDSESDYPSTQVVPLPSDPHFAKVSGYLGEALSDDMNSDAVIMVASPSQDVVVQVLRQQAKAVEPRFLAKARVYVAADDAHMPAIKSALAHTGAQVIQLDINSVIPQRPERLKRPLRNLSNDD